MIDPLSRQRLGVGHVIAESFRVLFSRVGVVVLLSLFPAAVILLVTTFVPPAGPIASASGWQSGLPNFASETFANSLAGSVITLAAFDAKLGRSARLSLYVQLAVRKLHVVFTVSVIQVALMALPVLIVLALLNAFNGFFWLVTVVLVISSLLAAICLWIVFLPAVPIVIIEDTGLSALARARQLTAGYRWPMLGVMIVLVVAATVAGFAIGFLFGSVGSVAGVTMKTLIRAVSGAIGSGIAAVGVAMLYARLRGIKEGTDFDTLADVFS